MSLMGRLLRFAVTGVGMTALHASVALGLIYGTAMSPISANATAFTVATIVSYVINSRWSFSARLQVTNALRFWVVSLVGLGLAMLVSGSVAGAGGTAEMGVLLVSAVVAPSNFLLHHFWTYRLRSRQSPTGDTPSRPTSIQS